jgi:DNA-3-methyladenine glycosylase I
MARRAGLADAGRDALHEHGETLEALLWSFAPPRDGARPPASGHELESATAESREMAKELKRHGFRFVGPTTAYSLMQAAGLVNDHLDGCEFRGPSEPDRRPPDLPRRLVRGRAA